MASMCTALAGAVVGRDDIHTQNFATPIGVQPGRHDGHHIHDLPTLATLLRERSQPYG